MTIPGFTVDYEFITPEQEKDLIRHIQAELIGVKDNINGFKHRSKVKRFGFEYGMKQVWLSRSPEWLYPEESLREFESVTINQYLPGNHIAPHIDSLAFSEPVLILSLNADADLRLHPPGEAKPIDLSLPRRSLASMSGDVRNKWEHSLENRLGDTRYSVVYRKRIIQK